MSAPHDASALLGSWASAERDTESVAGLDISRRGDGYLVSATGGGTPAPRPWGAVSAAPCAMAPDSRLAGAMVAFYDFGFLETTLTFFLKNGMIILDTFNDFKDGSRRAGYFTREFLYRRKAEAQSPPPRAGAATAGATRGKDRAPGPGQAGPLPSVDPAPVVGTWQSCDAETRGIERVVIASAGARLDLQAFGAGEPGSLDWGVTPCAPYPGDASGGLAIGCKALYRLPARRVLLAAYLNKGLLAIDSFHLFEGDSERPSYRARDHFFRR